MSNRQAISLLTLTVAAKAALEAERFVTGAGAYAGAGANALGVSKAKGAIGDQVPVDVIGTVIVTAGAAIAANAAIEVGANGKAITASSGAVVARAAPGATAAADGDPIEVILIQN